MIFEKLSSKIVHLHSLLFPANLSVGRELVDWLSPDELDRAARLRFEDDRQRFLMSHAWTRSILGSYLGVHPRALHLGANPGGKPVVIHGSGPAVRQPGFSLAHCGKCSVLAVAASQLVGVDVEQIRPEIDARGISSRFFSREEDAEFDTLPAHEVSSHFVKLWTCKEAFVKAIGLGLAYPLDRFVVSGLRQGRPEYTRLEPEYGPASRWSLRMFALASDCHVALAAGIPDARDLAFP